VFSFPSSESLEISAEASASSASFNAASPPATMSSIPSSALPDVLGSDKSSVRSSRERGVNSSSCEIESLVGSFSDKSFDVSFSSVGSTYRTL